eukprot:TRINITY_DN484_c0_g1_i1.p1 TRINITY_DN484_c0_g1~~TRINITY_DN484_c0_g1_i1.p1  ORF type:complete len:389 (-),score=26.42 TRINITY_DN484_c0_g1_i1:98-1150(-)
MKQVILEKPEEGVKIKEVPIPKPGPKEVLVKVECAPLMPLDRLLESGQVFPPPYVFGAQASGTVIELGPDSPQDLLNKKVHIGTSLLRFNLGTWQGLWSQYVVKPFEEIYVYDQSLSHEVACAMYGNPLTALGIYRKVRSLNAISVIIAPGASHIAKILTNLLMRDGVKVISIVRSEESAKILKDMGYELVVNSADPKSQEAFNELVAKYSPTVLVDAVANEASTKMFLLMPPKSTLLLYGAMSGNQVVHVPVFPMVLADKAVSGYYWSAEDFYKPRGEIVKELDMVNEDLVKGGKIFGVPIIKRYKMEQFMEAIKEQPTFASKGIGIITFHQQPGGLTSKMNTTEFSCK